MKILPIPKIDSFLLLISIFKLKVLYNSMLNFSQQGLIWKLEILVVFFIQNLNLFWSLPQRFFVRMIHLCKHFSIISLSNLNFLRNWRPKLLQICGRMRLKWCHFWKRSKFGFFSQIDRCFEKNLVFGNR